MFANSGKTVARKVNKGLENLTSWVRGQSGNPNGRPRRAIATLEKGIGIEFNVSLSKDDKYQILESMLEMDLNSLQQIASDKTSPAFMVNIAMAIRKDIHNGRISTVSELFDRFFGKPYQTGKLDITTGGEKLNKDLKDMSDDDLLRIINERNKD